MEQPGGGVNRLLPWQTRFMPDPRPLLVRDPRFRAHVAPPGHPERPGRLDAIDRALSALAERISDVAPRPATDEEIRRVHSPDHLALLRKLEGQATQLDADTYTSPRSPEVARLAAGSTVDLALRIARGEARSAFALIRPPGHHAERARAMGFCLINNVAVAAQALREEAGVERVAIIDWDVHHGNGTQHLFETERDVLYLSLHQFPFYPGTGALHEQGRDHGHGSTLNLPLPAGCGDAEYGAAFEEIIAPTLLEFRPEILLVSAGFDAHARDPLASMQVTRRGFRGFTATLRAVAEEACEGRILLTLEGGYDADALGESVAEVIEALGEKEGRPGDFPPVSTRGRRLVDGFREAHAPRWTSLRISERS